MGLLNRLRFALACWLMPTWAPSRNLPSDGHTPQERAAMLRTLAHHEGFRILTDHLERAKAVYERQLATPQGAPHSLDELLERSGQRVRLETAVYWIGWLRNEIERAKAMPDART